MKIAFDRKAVVYLVESGQLARTELVRHGSAPSANYAISSSIKVHSGASSAEKSSQSTIKLMCTYKDLNDGSGRGRNAWLAVAPARFTTK